MLGRKKPAPEPLSLSGPASGITRHQQNTPNDSHTQSSGIRSPSISTPASARPFDTSRSPTSAGLFPSPPSQQPTPKQPQTVRDPASQSNETTDAISNREQFGQRRPSQVSHNSSGLQSTDRSTSTSPIEQHYPLESPNTRRVPSNEKKIKGGFFHFNKPSRTANQLPSHHQRPASVSWNRFDSRGTDGPITTQHGNQWQPDFPRPTIDHRLETSTSDISVASAPDRHVNSPASPWRPKSKGIGRLTRTKSNRDKDGSKISDSQDPMPSLQPDYDAHGETPLRTAPVAPERSFREMMDSQVRNRSASRSREKDHRGRATPPPIRENGGSTFLSGLRNSSTKAAGMFGKNFFGKGSSRGATNERGVAFEDEHYELKVLNLPLVAQTRKTRISKRLESSRDKTEFWMPAFPWRAIDYLNYKGCEVEGLYRVPGSGPQVKKWQRRFDEEHDVNLFEVDDLYDINVVGSMLKAWLRELPDELFPKASQERVARESSGLDKVPQVLIDELSSLSPFQYYLLFAITCHLSLLLAHSDKNKMDFRNLCICFQPCMKIDSFCFKFLVCDWRDCWKGCKNEAAYIEQEYILFDQPPPRGFVQATQARPTTPDPEEAKDAQNRVDKISRKKLQDRSDSENSIHLRQEKPQHETPLERLQEKRQEKLQEKPRDKPQEMPPAKQHEKHHDKHHEKRHEKQHEKSQEKLLKKPQKRESTDASHHPRGLGDARDEKPLPDPHKERDKERQPSPAASNKSDSSYHSANDKLIDAANARFQTSESKSSVSSGDRTISTTLTINSDRDLPSRTTELRPLSPIKPLSPMFGRPRRTGKEPGSPTGIGLRGLDDENA